MGCAGKIALGTQTRKINHYRTQQYLKANYCKVKRQEDEEAQVYVNMH